MVQFFLKKSRDINPMVSKWLANVEEGRDNIFDNFEITKRDNLKWYRVVAAAAVDMKRVFTRVGHLHKEFEKY